MDRPDGLNPSSQDTFSVGSRTPDEPYYLLLLRAPGAEAYTNEAGHTDKAQLIAEANRALMRGVATAMVVKVEFWEEQLTQGRREPFDW